MKEKIFKITNKLGLHARAAAKIVALTSKFKSKITITNGKKMADAKSIMKILMLAAPKNTALKVNANGKDESQAMDAIESLFLNKFDEE
tara:strand:+ start:162 stop:428 length:267 start_codon:yes stop_codon:yes gene_type:complete